MALLAEYTAAGFDPAGFWTLTPRLYVTLMRGARARIDMQIEMGNRQAWNTAALTGGAMAGKLPAYEKVFGGLRAGAPQTPDMQQVMCDALASQWGAVMEA